MRGRDDKRARPAGSRVNLFRKGLFNHDVEVTGGVLEEECASLLTSFFRQKRAQKAPAPDNNI